MKLVDSSGWIEYFTDGPLAARFGQLLVDEASVLTPTIVLYEVYKLVRRERSEEAALAAVAVMQRTNVVPLTEAVALTAADLSLAHGLAMADAVVYATGRLHDAEVVTADEDFRGLPGVAIFGKKAGLKTARRRRRRTT